MTAAWNAVGCRMREALGRQLGCGAPVGCGIRACRVCGLRVTARGGQVPGAFAGGAVSWQVAEVGGSGTFGACGDAFLAPGAGEPGDDLGGQAGCLFQRCGQLVRADLRPPLVESLGLQPFGDPPSAVLRVLVGA